MVWYAHVFAYRCLKFVHRWRLIDKVCLLQILQSTRSEVFASCTRTHYVLETQKDGTKTSFYCSCKCAMLTQDYGVLGFVWLQRNKQSKTEFGDTASIRERKCSDRFLGSLMAFTSHTSCIGWSKATNSSAPSEVGRAVSFHGNRRQPDNHDILPPALQAG